MKKTIAQRYHALFGGIVIFLFCLLVLVHVHSYRSMKFEWNTYVENINEGIEGRIGSLFVDMNNFPGGADKDMRFLRSVKENYPDVEVLASIYTAFAGHQLSYRTFVLVDKEGVEILGVDCRTRTCITYHPEKTTAKNWKDESIFEDVKNIPVGSVTGTELILEKDASGRPVSYMYYGIGIYDSEGNFDGEIITSVDTRYFLDDIRSFSRAGEEIFLIDREGRYLVNNDRSKELSITPSANFKIDFPIVSSRILKEKGTTFESKGKVFTFRRIYFSPTGIIGTHGNLDGHYWILVDVVSKNTAYPNLAELRKEGWKALLIFDLLLVSAICIICFVWRSISL